MDTPAQALACALEGSELLGRIQAWQGVVSRATNRRVADGQLIATYPNDTQLLQRLRELIDGEASCCPFLEFSVEEGPDLIVTELRLPEEMPAPMKSLILELMGHDGQPAPRETVCLGSAKPATGGNRDDGSLRV
jgi:hypothetical protein